MKNFDRQYRMSAGPPGSTGFEIGGTTPYSLHISFSVQKQELESSNTAKVQVWNLNKQNLATLEAENCFLLLKAGYGNTLPVILSGTVSHTSTRKDGSDMLTEIEVVDGLMEVRDTWVSMSYAGKVNTKKILDDTAAQMGLLRSINGALSAVPRGSHASPRGIFTVRGHYRHYKSGKVVWVAEYKKGTGKQKGKTYKIGGDKK